MSFALALVAAYLIGSIPFGLLLTRAAGLGDVRKIGSGNIGATNVMRTGHKGLGIATLLLDAGKGLVAIWLAAAICGQDFAPFAGLMAVVGHIFPVWLRFKGGKGVATAIGAFFGMNVLLGAVICGIWVSVFLFTRFSSFSSIIGIGFSWAPAYLLGNEIHALIALNLAALVLFSHRANIARLLIGAEYDFKGKSQ